MPPRRMHHSAILLDRSLRRLYLSGLVKCNNMRRLGLMTPRTNPLSLSMSNHYKASSKKFQSSAEPLNTRTRPGDKTIQSGSLGPSMTNMPSTQTSRLHTDIWILPIST